MNKVKLLKSNINVTTFIRRYGLFSNLGKEFLGNKGHSWLAQNPFFPLLAATYFLGCSFYRSSPSIERFVRVTMFCFGSILLLRKKYQGAQKNYIPTCQTWKKMGKGAKHTKIFFFPFLYMDLQPLAKFSFVTLQFTIFPYIRENPLFL